MTKWMLNLKIRTKLLLGKGLLIFFLICQAVFAWYVMMQLQKAQALAFKVEFTNVVDLLNLRHLQNIVRAVQLESLVAATAVERQTARQNLDRRVSEIGVITERLLARYQDDPERRKYVEQIAEAFRMFKEARDTRVIPLVDAGKFDQARQLIVGPQTDRIKATVALSETLEKTAAERSARAIGDSEQLMDQSLRVFLIITLLAVAAGIFIAVYINRIIALPVKAVSHAAAKISAGELDVTPPLADRADEVGQLLQSFNRMTDYLRSAAAVADRIAVGDVQVRAEARSDKDVLGNAFRRMTLYLSETAHAAERIASGDLRVEIRPLSDQDVFGMAFARMVDNLKMTTAELTEGVSVLTSTTSEILASATQVAAGVTETATAISQTTATVEEVKQAGQLSNQKARHVVDSAQKANDVTQSGIKAVTAAINGMSNVQDQVASVAQSIVSLSEQSQAIGEIIATVNDLAEQSNLLAVNASIEAVKAGEQGKGFTVVAQEIRSLAEQSKQATVQVRQILNDIQKATSVAVMATEQGTKTVEQGMRQSREASDSIRLLGETVNEAAQAAVQIAASCQQQLAGMGQVALAMENIKTASTQNVDSTRQTESAAQNLHGLGQKIKTLVERYQV